MALTRRNSLWLLLAWLMAVIGFALGIFLDGMWFARFGSLVVLFGVMSEYSLLHNELHVLYQRLDKIGPDDPIPDLSPSKWHHKKVWLSHLTVILGTVIWGFGDLLFS